MALASRHNLFLLLAFLIAFSVPLICRTASGARILLTTSEPTENSLFKDIPGHGKPEFFKKPPCDPKSKLPDHPKFEIPAHPHPHPKVVPVKPDIPGGGHEGIPKVVPKPIFIKHDPPKFKIPPKLIIKAAAADKSDHKPSDDGGSKFSTAAPYSIPHPDFIPPRVPLTPQSDDSKAKPTASPTTSTP